jgi:lipopolysaccharide biosynthesis glycosyltransferase
MIKKKVLILGNGISRLQFDSYVKSFDGEIWVCNQAYKEYKKFGRISAVFTVHKEVALSAFKFRQERGLRYKVYCSQVLKGYEGTISTLYRYRGWSSGSEAIHQALIDGYDKIELMGFDFGGSDVYQKHSVYGGNFRKQFLKILDEFGSDNLEIIGCKSKEFSDMLSKKTKARLNIKDKPPSTFIKKVEVLDEYKKILSKIDKASVCIVGNSPTLLERKMGGVIDHFSTVIRLNDFITNGFEEHVGSKTTFWCTGAGTNTLIKNRFIPQMPIENKPVVILPESRFKNSLDFVKSSVQKNLGIPSSSLDIISEKEIKILTNKIKLKQPTTGLLAIAYWRFIKNKKVYIIGFDFFKKHKNHYYDETNIKVTKIHDFNKEEELVNQWIESGTVERLSDLTQLPENKDNAGMTNAEIIQKELNTDKNIDLSRVGLFSLVTDDYLMPFTIFIKSLLHTNPWFNLDYLILDVGLSDDVKKKMKEVYANVKFIKVKDKGMYDKIDMSITHDKLKATYYKLELFNQTAYDKVIMIDIDMLVVGDISGLVFDRREGIFGCRCYNENNHTLSHNINTGVVVVTKEYLNKETHEKIVDFVKCGFNMPDQKGINRFFKNKIQYLSKKYNVEKRMIYNTNPTIQILENDVRIWHYVGANPWDEKKIDKEQKFGRIEKLWFDFKDKVDRGEI